MTHILYKKRKLPLFFFLALLTLPLISHAHTKEIHQNTLTLNSILCLFYDTSLNDNGSEGSVRDLVRNIIKDNQNTVAQAQNAISLNKPNQLKKNLIPLLHSIQNTLVTRMNIIMPLNNATPSYLISKLNNSQCQQQFLREEAHAEWLVGSQFYHGNQQEKNFPTAFAWFTKSSQKNYAKAHHWLGILHFQGLGTPKNYTQALQHFQKADSLEKLPETSYSLGLFYEKGLASPKNIFKAHTHYQHAANNHITNAQVALAKIYSHNSQHLNLVNAYKWWDIADTKGHPNAAHQKQLVLSRMTSLQKWEAQRRSKVWLQQNPSPQSTSTAKG